MDIIPSTLSLQKLPSHFQTHNNDPNNWNLTIKQHAKSNNDHAILTTYSQMESLGISPDRATLPLVLKACAKLNAVDRGKEIHRTARESGSIGDVRVGTALVDFYGKCGLVEDARDVFDEMRERDIVLWNAMLFGYVKCRFFKNAVLLFTRMQSEGLRPNSRTVVGLLSACKESRQFRLGQEIHGFCIRNGQFYSDPHVETALIGFYSKFDVGVSRLVFDSMSVRNIVSWNSIITGFVDSGENLKACHLFLALIRDGISFDRVTVLAGVQACSELRYLDLGMQIHQLAAKSGYRNDLFIVNALINMYSECGRLDLGLRLFESVPNRDLALWNSTIDSYIEHGIYDEAVRLLARLRAERIGENERTIAIVLPLCPHISDGLRNGKGLHAQVIKVAMELDVSLGNAFLRMYSELSCVESVRRVFDEMTSVDIVSWNTLIMAFASKGLKTEAWNVFEAMGDSQINPNSHTIVSILSSCRDVTCLGIGRSLHGFSLKHGVEIDPSLNTALVDMYTACGDEEMGTSLFEKCPERDVISWNALIASHVRNNRAEKAQSLFRRMITEAEPNEVTIVNMLSSCTQLAAVSEGQSLHAYITRRKPLFDYDLSLWNALVSMYARCGSMGKAERVFEISPRRNTITWNALITGYASHGLADKAILALSHMLEDSLIPNATTFAAILSACRHCGYVDKGLRFFRAMVRDFEMKPELIHYGCVVDLLCRGGRLSEARDFIESMPGEPDASLWRALLGACRVDSDSKAEFARTVFEKLVEIEPMNAGNYVLLSNMYASAGIWEEARKIRATLREKGLRKSPGISWIVVRSEVHCFGAGDTSHPCSETIYENLNSLTALIKLSGYAAEIYSVLHQED